MGYIGQRIPGRNNLRLARGAGQFTADVQMPNPCFMALVRSPYAHAEIEHVDVSAAQGLPGVIDIATAAEVAQATRPFSFARPPEVEVNLADMDGKRLREYALAERWVGYSGRPVAAVVAEDPNTAAEAAERVAVQYRELPVVASAEDALKPGSPGAIPGWNDNLVFHTRYAKGDAASAIAKAPGVITGRVQVQRHVPVPLEPRAFVADYSTRTGRLTMYASTQMPHTDRSILAGALGMASEDVQVIQPDVGGGFGCKVPGSDEEVLVAFFARRLERPVRWTEERSEYFLACGHARETWFDFEAGYREDGKLLALRIDAVADIGLPFGAWVQSSVTAYCLPCGYAVDHCEVSMRSVVTNKCKWGGYRGFGKEAASFCMERIMDRIADAAGLDRVEVRLCNFIPADAFPYGQVSGALLDSGNYQGAMAKLLALVDQEAFRQEQAAARTNGRCLGLGIGFELTPEGCSMPNSDFLQGWDGATVRMDPGGRVTVLTGVTSPGSGNETGIAMIVADELGVPLDTVTVVQGDTDRCPYGLGNFSSRSLMIGGSAALAAARELREKLLSVGAKMLDADPEDLELANGEIRVAAAPAPPAADAPRNPGGPAWSVP
ncbi:MAG: xanthine dehydrogenase family protein, partial [Gammaproteobacteria bacterium]|nr:xanthine dehydrogenase family protein [Gammaproteobacteria bacterium]